MVTNVPFVVRVEKGDETSVYITEFAVIGILGTLVLQLNCQLQSEPSQHVLLTRTLEIQNCNQDQAQTPLTAGIVLVYKADSWSFKCAG